MCAILASILYQEVRKTENCHENQIISHILPSFLAQKYGFYMVILNRNLTLTQANLFSRPYIIYSFRSCVNVTQKSLTKSIFFP